MQYRQEEPGQPKAYDPPTIAQRATVYYTSLFDPMEADPDEEQVCDLFSKKYDDWHNDMLVCIAEEVATATNALAMGKTTGRDWLPGPAEAWRMAMEKDLRVSVAMAWAFNYRILAPARSHTTAQPAQRQDD